MAVGADVLDWSCADETRDFAKAFDAVKATFDGRSYYGSADISMPAGLSLPKGQWSVEIIGRDGSTVNREFDVSYTDAAEALGNFTEAGQEAPWFDEKSNLTVIK